METKVATPTVAVAASEWINAKLYPFKCVIKKVLPRHKDSDCMS